MTPEEAKTIRSAALALAAQAQAIVSLVDALSAQPKPPEPPQTCKNCGSPQWEPGGMGNLYRKCLDCGSVYGDAPKND